MHTLRKIFFISILVALSAAKSLIAQTIGNMSLDDYRVIKQMNIGTYNSALKRTNSAAYLELGDSLNSKKALLLPRGNIDSVANPIRGLLFYNIPDDKIYYHDGTIWIALGSGGSGLTYPYTAGRYLNGYGNFVALNTDSITEGSTNLWNRDFGKTGEDDLAGENRLFDLTGSFDFELRGSDASNYLKFSPTGNNQFSHLSTNGTFFSNILSDASGGIYLNADRTDIAGNGGLVAVYNDGSNLELSYNGNITGLQNYVYSGSNIGSLLATENPYRGIFIDSANGVLIGRGLTTNQPLTIRGVRVRPDWSVYIDSLASTDTATAKAVGIGADGKLYDMGYWPGGGGGATPTLQQVMDAGSTLTSSEQISTGSNLFTIFGTDASHETYGVFGGDNIQLYRQVQVGGTSSYLYITDSVYLNSQNTAEPESRFILYPDSIVLRPYNGDLRFKGLNNGGTASDSVLVITSDGVVKKRHPTVFGGGTSTLQQVTDEGNTTTNNIQVLDGASIQVYHTSNPNSQIVINNGSIGFGNGGFYGTMGTTLTDNRDWILPDADGTVALTSDIPAGAGNNFANTDLTFTGNRTHDANGNNLLIGNIGSGNILSEAGSYRAYMTVNTGNFAGFTVDSSDVVLSRFGTYHDSLEIVVPRNHFSIKGLSRNTGGNLAMMVIDTSNGSKRVYYQNIPTGAGGGTLDDLTDVEITTATTDDLLRYNGSAWVNTTVSSFAFSRKIIHTTVTGTDANITAAAGTAYNLPAATLSTGRTIDVTNLNQNGDYVEFYNNEEGFVWSFTGATVYDSDGATAVTELLINANSVIRRVNGKLMISKL